MSKIKVLFENSQFEQTKYIEGNYKYASDIALSDMLTSCGMSAKCFDENKSNKRNTVFGKHPRILDGNSTEESDQYSETSSQSQERNLIRHVSYHKINSTMKNQVSTNKICDNKTKEVISKICDKQDEYKSRDFNESAKENLFCQKQSTMFSKINSFLEDIRVLFQAGVRPVESADDYMRREKKAVEFASRLSRNYLYQLGRQIVEFQKLLKSSSCKTKVHISQRLSLNQRLLNMHQIIIQALQAYCSYIPTSLETKSNIKFNELLLNIIELCSLTKKFREISDIHSPCPIVEEVETNCKSFKHNENVNTNVKLQQNQTKTKQSRTKVSLANENVSQIQTLPFHKKESLADRLSMYNVQQTKLPKGSCVWKKSTMLLAKQRFNMQSRYKIIHDKKNVINQKKSLEPRKSSKLLESNSFHIPEKQNEDEIVTMIEMDKKRKTGTKDNIKTSNDVKNKLEPLLQNLIQEINKEELMDQSLCSDVLDSLTGILNKMHHLNPSDRVDNVPSTIDKAHAKSDGSKKTHKSNITVTGPKNARLICIKDKSCFEPDTQETAVAASSTSCDNEREVDKTESNDKAEAKNLKYLQTLPKKFAINIIQYKIEFHKFTKPNHMYKKTLGFSPWELTSKISDKLLDKLFIVVLQEMEFSKIVEKVYKSEFE